MIKNNSLSKDIKIVDSEDTVVATASGSGQVNGYASITLNILDVNKLTKEMVQETIETLEDFILKIQELSNTEKTTEV